MPSMGDQIQQRMMTTPKKPIPLQIVDGMRFPPKFLKKCLKETLNYKPQPDDLIISTYPKCGTTWMQVLVTQILRKGQPLKNPIDFYTISPFLEMVGDEGVRRMTRPGLIKTHLPYDRMPYSPQAKYIYVIRNPFDACVSLYHHTYLKRGFEYWDGTFDDFFEEFMNGRVEFNDYFDHLLSWYPHINDEQVYWTTYEAMKKDLKTIIIELAQFLGKDYSHAIRSDNEVMNNILKHSDFTYMKDMYSRIDAARKLGPSPDMPSGLAHLCQTFDGGDNREKRPESVTPHIRKGIVGDWKNHFSEDQYEKMKEKFFIKTQGTEIGNWWPDLFSH